MLINESILEAFRTSVRDSESAEELDGILDEIPEQYQDELSDEIADKKSELLSGLEDASSAEILQRIKEDEFLQELIKDSGVVGTEDSGEDEDPTSEDDAPESEGEESSEEAEDDADSDEADDDLDEEGADANEDDEDPEEEGASDDEDVEAGAEEDSDPDEDAPEADEDDPAEEDPEDSLDELQIEDDQDLSDFLDQLPISEGVVDQIQARMEADTSLSDSTRATLFDAAEQLGVETESIEDSDPSDVIAALRQKAERLDAAGSGSVGTSAVNDLDVIRSFYLG